MESKKECKCRRFYFPIRNPIFVIIEKNETMPVAEQIIQLKNELPVNVKLVAVSKTMNSDTILEAYQAGQRVFGENRPQELRDKQDLLPKDIEWHFIGHLQTNKVKYIAPFVSLIHSVESIKLLEEINREGKKNQRVIPCLLEFHIADEESKFGLNTHEAYEILKNPMLVSFQNICINGVMGMATFTNNENQIRKEFKQLKQIFDQLKHEFFPNEPRFCEISMGMSGDYTIAIQEGSTLVRIGSRIFGHR